MIEGLASLSLLVGAFFILLAAVGLVRLPDLYCRLHAATKPQILGLILIVIALALSVRSWAALLLLLVLAVLLGTPGCLSVRAALLGRGLDVRRKRRHVPTSFLLVRARDWAHSNLATGLFQVDPSPRERLSTWGM